MSENDLRAYRAESVTTMSENDLRAYRAESGHMRAPWPLNDGRVIELITPSELAGLPPGTVLVDIFGAHATVGHDRIDDDTRGGMLAYGLERKAGGR